MARSWHTTTLKLRLEIGHSQSSKPNVKKTAKSKHHVKGYAAPFFEPITFMGANDLIALGQMRTVDQMRLVKGLGVISDKTLRAKNRTVKAICGNVPWPSRPDALYKMHNDDCGINIVTILQKNTPWKLKSIFSTS